MSADQFNEDDLFTMRNTVRGIRAGTWDPTDNTKRWVASIFSQILACGTPSLPVAADPKNEEQP